MIDGWIPDDGLHGVEAIDTLLEVKMVDAFVEFLRMDVVALTPLQCIRFSIYRRIVLGDADIFCSDRAGVVGKYEVGRLPQFQAEMDESASVVVGGILPALYLLYNELTGRDPHKNECGLHQLSVARVHSFPDDLRDGLQHFFVSRYSLQPSYDFGI